MSRLHPAPGAPARRASSGMRALHLGCSASNRTSRGRPHRPRWDTMQRFRRGSRWRGGTADSGRRARTRKNRNIAAAPPPLRHCTGPAIAAPSACLGLFRHGDLLSSSAPAPAGSGLCTTHGGGRSQAAFSAACDEKNGRRGASATRPGWLGRKRAYAPLIPSHRRTQATPPRAPAVRLGPLPAIAGEGERDRPRGAMRASAVRRTKATIFSPPNKMRGGGAPEGAN